MGAMDTGLAASFLAADYVEFTDGTRIPSPHEYANLRKTFYTQIDGKGYRAYAIEIRVYDMYRLPWQRSRTRGDGMPRYILEAHVSFYGNGMEGDEETPITNVHFTAKNVAKTEAHADLLWKALGRTYYE